MNLKKVLAKEAITLDLKAKDKNGIIVEMVDLLKQSGKIKDTDNIVEAVLKRESQMSTGMQSGVAIPHGKSSAVNELVACIGLSKKGVDFQALDGKPSHIFVMTISPTNKTGPHVQFIAEISRLLIQPNIREAILAAESREAVLKLFLN